MNIKILLSACSNFNYNTLFYVVFSDQVELIGTADKLPQSILDSNIRRIDGIMYNARSRAFRCAYLIMEDNIDANS